MRIDLLSQQWAAPSRPAAAAAAQPCHQPLTQITSTIHFYASLGTKLYPLFQKRKMNYELCR